MNDEREQALLALIRDLYEFGVATGSLGQAAWTTKGKELTQRTRTALGLEQSVAHPKVDEP